MGLAKLVPDVDLNFIRFAFTDDNCLQLPCCCVKGWIEISALNVKRKLWGKMISFVVTNFLPETNIVTMTNMYIIDWMQKL